MSSTPGRGRTEQWPSPITPLPWTASGSAERPKVLEAASRSVEGDLNGLSVLYEYTLALLEHLKQRPIRVDSDPSPQAGTRTRRQCGRAREQQNRPPRGARSHPVWLCRRMARKSSGGLTGCDAISTDPRFRFGSCGETS